MHGCARSRRLKGMLTTLLLLFLQAAQKQPIEEAVAAFARGDAAARDEVLKGGIGAILELRKVRERAPEKIDALIYELKTADGVPAKSLLEALEGKQSLEFGVVN